MDAVGPQRHDMLAPRRRCFHASNSAPNSVLTRAIVDADSGAVAPSNGRAGIVCRSGLPSNVGSVAVDRPISVPKLIKQRRKEPELFPTKALGDLYLALTFPHIKQR